MTSTARQKSSTATTPGAPESKPGLYVHVPFCRSKCPYCGFYSVVDPDSQERWLAALEVESRQRAGAWEQIDTCYVGGGTPSTLPDDALVRLSELLDRFFHFSAAVERTLEVNPADVTPSRARLWRELGFDRVSVGVQSFRATELRWLGRRHDPDRAARALDDLRTAGFERIGIDLVQGLPGQSLNKRRESLDRALAFDPEHLSVYELTVEPNTPLAREVATCRSELVDPDLAADAWLATSEELSGRGYDHYEVSNYSRGPEHRSRHNSKYWTLVPYLGLGPAAHSYSGRVRWSNVRSVSGYCDALENGDRPIGHEEELTDEQLRWERVALGLRTSTGITQRELGEGSQELEIRVAELVDRGLVERMGDRLVPTLRGMLVADAMARCLLFGSRS
jgi:putative oxygen-independent coproporphyrinogen III oxidase